MKEYNRIYASIDLDAIHHNMEAMHGCINRNTKIIGVIKADGYGHGAVEIAHETEQLSYVWGFATATIEEALILRKNNITKPILILGYIFEEDIRDLIAKDISPTVFSFKMAEGLSKVAAASGKTVKIHIKIDTGMSRIGFQVEEECADEIAKIAQLPNIKVEGLFTHFSKADEADKTDTFTQIKWYEAMLSMLKDRGIEIPYRHCSNSAGIVDIPAANMDAVRAGITLYGLWPSAEVDQTRICLQPVMGLKSKIIHIKTLEKGRSVSYGGTYTLTGTKRIATIPAGYGDGYPRGLSNKGYVLIHGKAAPILGRICMDQFMVDVTDIKEAKVLDTVTLLGKDGEKVITMEELGHLSGRFNYEFACDIGKRVPRVYYKNKKIISTRDYFSE